MTSVCVAEAERRAILSVLKKHFPGAKAHVFGSRVRGDQRNFSDLDIAVETDLGIAAFAMANADLSDLPIPFKVDLIEWNTLSENFKAVIARETVLWLL